MTVLVTGWDGFVGVHLGALLTQNGSTPLPFEDHGKLVDLRDPDAVKDFIAKTKPDRVYHLAALSNVGQSWKDPDAFFAVNAQGTRNLLEALRHSCPKARVLMVSTGVIYGDAAKSGALMKETDPTRPQNPYAKSKLEAEAACREYFDHHGLDCRVVRPHGHTGPGQALGFVVPDFASQIANVANGTAPPSMNVGALDVKREFGDVRDVVRAYHRVMERGAPGQVYNLATNEPHAIREVANALMEAAGVKVELIQDPDRMRKVDESALRLDTTKITDLGFNFEIPFATTMADVIKEWIEKTKS